MFMSLNTELGKSWSFGLCHAIDGYRGPCMARLSVLSTFGVRSLKALWSITEHESNYDGIGNRNSSQFRVLGVQLHDAHSGFSIRHFYHHSYNYSEETAHTVRAYQLQAPRTYETFREQVKKADIGAGRISVFLSCEGIKYND